MKFTEEQYQKIVEKFEVAISYIDATHDVMGYLDSEDLGDIAEEAFALANPLTREWAHDKFVEKEKKYYWTSKKRAVNDVNKKSRIYREEFSGALLTYTRVTHDHKNINEEEQLTESEIEAWGYNPEMFDREEA